MEYISNKLCHFVGGALQTDKDRFELLVKIIKGGRLLANKQNLDKPGIHLNNKYKGDRVGEVYEKIDCVCFCDIPDNALDIHTRKYGKCGIGFDKHYLTTKGARPVKYIPMNCDIKDISPTVTPKNPKEYFNVLAQENANLYTFLTIVDLFHPFSKVLEEIKSSPCAQMIKFCNVDAIKDGKFRQLLFAQMMAFTKIIAYTKLFDETLSQDDENNYYMEREWRILSSVEFDLDNIDKIYLPSKEYEKYFMNEFADYKGIFYIF